MKEHEHRSYYTAGDYVGTTMRNDSFIPCKPEAMLRCQSSQLGFKVYRFRAEVSGFVHGVGLRVQRFKGLGFKRARHGP